MADEQANMILSIILNLGLIFFICEHFYLRKKVKKSEEDIVAKAKVIFIIGAIVYGVYIIMMILTFIIKVINIEIMHLTIIEIIALSLMVFSSKLMVKSRWYTGVL